MLKLTKLSAVISSYLAKFRKHNKSIISFLCGIPIIFPFYLCDSLIHSKDRVIKVNSKCNGLL